MKYSRNTEHQLMSALHLWLVLFLCWLFHGRFLICTRNFLNLVMLAIIIMYVSKQMWGAVAISVGMSFGAFLLTFAAVAVGMALENVGDKLSEWLAS